MGSFGTGPLSFLVRGFFFCFCFCFRISALLVSGHERRSEEGGGRGLGRLGWVRGGQGRGGQKGSGWVGLVPFRLCQKLPARSARFLVSVPVSAPESTSVFFRPLTWPSVAPVRPVVDLVLLSERRGLPAESLGCHGSLSSPTHTPSGSFACLGPFST
jgi:hypothetical protein